MTQMASQHLVDKGQDCMKMLNFKLLSKIHLLLENLENLCTVFRKHRDACNDFSQRLISDNLMFKDALFCIDCNSVDEDTILATVTPNACSWKIVIVVFVNYSVI